MTLVEAGGGVLLRQLETSGETLAAKIVRMYHQRAELAGMGAALGCLDHPESAETIARELILIARKES
jgi:UDP-N-acetylglucosamine:LPS N-acetylglucosamine transferase